MDLAGDAVPYYKDYQVMLSYGGSAVDALFIMIFRIMPSVVRLLPPAS